MYLSWILILSITIAAVHATTLFTISEHTLPLKMNKMGVGFYADSLIVFKGNNETAATNTTSILSPFNPRQTGSFADEWQITQNDMNPFDWPWVTYSGQATTQIDNAVYGMSAFLLIYDLQLHAYRNTSTYNWTVPGGSRASPCVTANALGTALYVLSGWDDASCHVYSIADDTWTAIASVPERLDSGCAMDAGSTAIFLFGGFNNEWLDTIAEYDVATNAWTELNATLPTVVYLLVCTLFPALNDHIYCVGGFDENNDAFLTHVNVFDPVARTVDWTTYALNIGRTYHSLVLAGPCLLVVGGASESNTTGTYLSYLDSIEYLCAPTAAPTTQMPSSGAPTTQPLSTQVPSVMPSVMPSVVPSMVPSSGAPTAPPLDPQNQAEQAQAVQTSFIILISSIISMALCL